MTSIIRESNSEQKITDVSHTNVIFPRRSLAFWKSKKYQDHRNSIEISLLLSIKLSIHLMFTLCKVLCSVLRHYGGCNDFKISTSLAVFGGNSSISIFILISHTYSIQTMGNMCLISCMLNSMYVGHKKYRQCGFCTHGDYHTSQEIGECYRLKLQNYQDSI